MSNQTITQIDSYIDQILVSKEVTDTDGKKYHLNSNVDQEEGKFINHLISSNNFKNTLEIGCAYGLSSMFICKSRINSTHCKHLIIDPNQSTDWNNIGISNLKKCGINFFELIEKTSDIALPELVSKKEQIDFCFIDGWHSFDQTLIDFFYCDKLIPVNGIIAIDDVQLPSVQKVIRFITSNLTTYKIIGSVSRPIYPRRKIANLMKALLNLVFKLVGKKIQHEFLSSSIYQNDKSIHLNSSLIAFQKIANDKRTWYHFAQF